MNNTSVQHTGARQTVLHCAAWAVFVGWLLLFVDGFILQPQMFLFHGRVPVHPLVKPVLFLSVVVVFLLRRKTISPAFLKIWACFSTYMMCHGAYFLFVRHFPSLYLFKFYNGIALLAILPLLPSLSGLLPAEKLVRVIKLVFIPVATLGLAQHFLNVTIVPPRSCDGRMDYGAYWFGHVRVFSFFSQSGYLALYMISVMLLCAAQFYGCQKTWQRIVQAVSFFICLLLVYWTYTRLQYLAVAFSLLSWVLVRRLAVKAVRKLVWLPVIYVAVGLLLVIGLYVKASSQPGNREYMDAMETKLTVDAVAIPKSITREMLIATPTTQSASCANFKFWRFSNGESGVAAAVPSVSVSASVSAVAAPVLVAVALAAVPVPIAPILSQQSLLNRVVEWRVFGRIGLKSWQTVLFGTPYEPDSFDIPQLRVLCIDNLYIELFLKFGLAGLVLFGLLYWQIWLMVLKHAALSTEPLAQALLLFSALPVVGILGTLWYYYFVAVLLVFFLPELPANGDGKQVIK